MEAESNNETGRLAVTINLQSGSEVYLRTSSKDFPISQLKRLSYKAQFPVVNGLDQRKHGGKLVEYILAEFRQLVYFRLP
jgi:hypothetical protein